MADLAAEVRADVSALADRFMLLQTENAMMRETLARHGLSVAS